MESAFGFRLIPTTPSSFLPNQLPIKLRLPSLQRSSFVDQQRNRKNVVRSCYGSEEIGPLDGFQFTPTKIFTEEAIGAEYGEDFETFRPDGPLKVDVDFLNDRLQEGFLKRIRYAMKPDEAYGLIFSWDNVVAGTQALKLSAWKELAHEGKEIPGDDDVQRLLLYGAPDHVLQKVLLWENEACELEKLKLKLSQIYSNNLLKLSEPMEGLKEWLDAVCTARIPCAVVSSLDRRIMVEILENMGLVKYFQAIVTEEDGMDSMAHRLLSAAVKISFLLNTLRLLLVQMQIW
ncbi:hypothetical protein L1987_11656 [Smallanthus sonchifolius]|uniref:Uncharacterized protein n=1 Tax=Smallanthus sonchifolius TaxID=185202 RepID=A0ACB9JF03_9ASTR|nr:hypothetical protein L1987_11656 [Smallanthus sonchifolius]